MKTTENNKLIAEFMGVFDKILSTGNIHSWSDAPFYYTTEDTKEKVIQNITKYSKYHKDWNWLMEVVEKCFATKADYHLHKLIEDALISSSGNRLEKTYNAVIKFINEYQD